MQHLPKLAYIGDVPVESSYYGSALLFRLLQDYPGTQVFIVEGLYSSQSERRLPGVMYASLGVGRERLLRTRFHRLYCAWLSITATLKAGRVRTILQGFCPEAVLTVGHGFSWITAAAFARLSRLPLHLIIHDDWPHMSGISQSLRGWLGNQFARVYREAASRFCVSPCMEEVYYRRYGVRGTVLYPSRAADCPKFDTPPERLLRSDNPFTVVYAGTINLSGYTRALVLLAKVLRECDGRLVIYGPLSPEQATAYGLKGPNIELRGMVQSAELIQRCRNEADVMFVPMSFEQEDKVNMALAFPSKLADYTAMGLPLLIYGPSYCSAVRWARETQGMAEVVDSADGAALAQAVHRLASKPESCFEMGTRALQVGHRFFAHESVRAAFRMEVSINLNPCCSSV